MKKEGYAKTIVLTIICLIIALVIILLLYFLSPENSPVRNFIEKTIGAEKPSDYFPEQEPNVNIQGILDGPSGSSSSGGSSGDGGSSSLNPNCSIKEVSYSLENPNKTSVCNSYEGVVCTDKTVYCSIQIKNRDDNIGGVFKVSTTFVPNEEVVSIDKKNMDINLGPREVFTFNSSTIIQSVGESGNANKQINCFYNTLEIPTEEIC